MRWAGFRRVRRQVCRRIARRLRELELPDASAYRSYLEKHPGEWTALDGLCRITISRFYRDRGIFDFLGEQVLPVLAEAAVAQGSQEVLCWSAGCASGEEPYSLKILWAHRVGPRFPQLRLRITATDADATLLDRARSGRFPESSLRDLPDVWRASAFARSGSSFRLRTGLREGIEFGLSDLRRELPPGPFHLVLCRNLAFTYFDDSLQREILSRLVARILVGGALVIGAHESLPAGSKELSAWGVARGVFRRGPVPERRASPAGPRQGGERGRSAGS
jgi:chemotaxis protein methyltransferase CheR